jgi:hypothetical protein
MNNTITIKVSDKIYNHLMWFLKRFSKDELEIVEIQNLEKLKSELHDDLKQSLNSPENHLSIEELDALLEDTLNKYEV